MLQDPDDLLASFARHRRIPYSAQVGLRPRPFLLPGADRPDTSGRPNAGAPDAKVCATVEFILDVIHTGDVRAEIGLPHILKAQSFKCNWEAPQPGSHSE